MEYALSLRRCMKIVQAQQMVESMVQPSTDVLVVSDLRKYYEEVKAVDGISLTIRSGEIYGLLGPNGAGKTTTIKSILGLLSLESGRISVMGFDPLVSPSLVKEKVGYVAEEEMLFESMTVKELLNFVASVRKLDPEIASATVQEYLSSLDALKYYDSFIGGLSHGNRQKVQIVAALIHEPELLILDEPLSGLDARSARVVKEILQIHIERGGAVLLTTHVMEQAQNLSTRIGIIANGKMVAEGTFKELQTLAQSAGESLEDVFLHLTDQHVGANAVVEKLRKRFLASDRG